MKQDDSIKTGSIAHDENLSTLATPKNMTTILTSSSSGELVSSNTSISSLTMNKVTEDEKQMVGGCCVCADDSGYSDNQLVYCDGHECLVAVHQGCYGIITVPEGNWYCKVCEHKLNTRDNPLEHSKSITCQLCPSKEGAFKRTDTGKWAHVICALYIPEITFGNNRTMEPIITSQIKAERYNKKCSICELNETENNDLTNSSTDLAIAASSTVANITNNNVSATENQIASSNGVYVNCSKNGCKHWYHVTCAQMIGLLCENISKNSNVPYSIYCKTHYSKLSNADVKRIPGFKFSSILLDIGLDPAPLLNNTKSSKTTNQKDLKRKAPNNSHNSTSTTTTPAAGVKKSSLKENNADTIASTNQKKSKKPRLSLAANLDITIPSINNTVPNTDKSDPITNISKTSLSLRNSNTSKSRQSSNENLKQSTKKPTPETKTTANKNSETIKSNNQQTISKINQKQIKKENDTKPNLTLDLSITQKILQQQESTSSDSGVALSLISPVDESSTESIKLNNNNNNNSNEIVNDTIEETSGAQKRKSRSNVNTNIIQNFSPNDFSDQKLIGLNLITPSSSSVSSVSSVSSTCSSNGGCSGSSSFNSKATINLNQKRSRKSLNQSALVVGINTVKSESVNAGDSHNPLTPPPSVVQDQLNLSVASNIQNNNVFDTNESTNAKNSTANTSLNNEIICNNNSNVNHVKSTSLCKNSIKKENIDESSSNINNKLASSDNSKFKLPNSKNENELKVIKTNKECWPKPPFIQKTSREVEEEENNIEVHQEESDEDEEDFPKTLESLLTKQWNLGLELLKEKCPSKSENNFDIIKLLNLLAECKKENQELETRLAELEKKKNHLEQMNTKLSTKFVFNDSKNDLNEKKDFTPIPSNFYPPHTSNTNQIATSITPQKSQYIQLSDQPLSSAPPRPSSSLSLHPPNIGTSSMTAFSQPIQNIPSKKQSNTTSASQNQNLLIASPISSASSANTSLNSSYNLHSNHQLTPPNTINSINRPHSQPHHLQSQQGNILMNSFNSTGNSNTAPNNNITSSFLNSYLQNISQHQHLNTLSSSSSNEISSSTSQRERGSNANINHHQQQQQQQQQQLSLSLLPKSLSNTVASNPNLAASLLNINNYHTNPLQSHQHQPQSQAPNAQSNYVNSLLHSIQTNSSPLNYQQIAAYYYAATNAASSSSSSSSSNTASASDTTNSILANAGLIKSPAK